MLGTTKVASIPLTKPDPDLEIRGVGAVIHTLR